MAYIKKGDEVKTKTRFIYRIEPETGVKERGNKEVVSTYKNKEDLVTTVIRSSFLPYIINGDLKYQDKLNHLN